MAAIRCIGILGLALCAVSALAQAARAAEPLSEKELGDKLKVYASISTLEASFHQVKTLKDLNLQIRSEGRFKLRRPDQVLWEITKPSPVSVSLSRDEITIKSDGTQTFRLSDAPSDAMSKNLAGLVAWLNLDAAKLSEEYRVFATGKSAFRFEPKHEDSSPFRELEMTLDSGGQLSRLILYEFSGDTVDIEFGKPKLTPKQQ